MPKTRTAKLPVIPESAVQSTAMAILSTYGCIVHRRNTGAMTIPASAGTSRRHIKFSEKGSSDLWGLLGPGPAYGAHYELEMKRRGERPTLLQTEWLIAHNGVGTSVAWWSDSSESVETVLRHVLAGGRIEYLDTTRVYAVKEKGRTYKIEAQSGDYRLI